MIKKCVSIFIYLPRNICFKNTKRSQQEKKTTNKKTNTYSYLNVFVKT